jgi:hypothetical protein
MIHSMQDKKANTLRRKLMPKLTLLNKMTQVKQATTQLRLAAKKATLPMRALP